MVYSMLSFGALVYVFSQCPWFWPAAAIFFVANIFASVFSTLNNTAIQLLIPDAVRGRISSFLMMSFSLPMLGTLPLAALAEYYRNARSLPAASLCPVELPPVNLAAPTELLGARKTIVETCIYQNVVGLFPLESDGIAA